MVAIAEVERDLDAGVKRIRTTVALIAGEDIDVSDTEGALQLQVGLGARNGITGNGHVSASGENRGKRLSLDWGG